MTPTPQQKLDAIRLACIAVNPSIKDLVFGCKIKFIDTDFVAPDFTCQEPPEWIDTLIKVYRNGIQDIEFHCENNAYCRLEDDESDYFEIIGRDIQLADVLRTICERTKTPGNYLLSMDGYFYEWTDIDKSPKFLDIYWKTLLPLHLQEEPTISFIFELIK